MRLIPFAGLLPLGGVLALGCNVAPTELADKQGIATVAAAKSFDALTTQAAVIIRNEGSCALMDGDGEFVSADRWVTVATQSTGQNTTEICKVKNVANSTGRAVRYTGEDTGISCRAFRPPDMFVVTTAWTETVSASGNATLRCHFKL
jgi:hypothetical protein